MNRSKLIIIIVIGLVLIGWIGYSIFHKEDKSIQLITEKPHYGAIATSVTATGKIQPVDTVETLLENRKKELAENEFFDRRDVNRITHLTELKNLKEILELIYDVAKEQRKVAEKLEPEIQSTIVKQ